MIVEQGAPLLCDCLYPQEGQTHSAVPPNPLGLGVTALCLPVLGPCPIGPVPSKLGIVIVIKFNMGIYPYDYNMHYHYVNGILTLKYRVGPLIENILVGETGLEPATSASQTQRSSHLNYSP